MSFYGRSFCLDSEGDYVTEPAGTSEGAAPADLELGPIKLVLWRSAGERCLGGSPPGSQVQAILSTHVGMSAMAGVEMPGSPPVYEALFFQVGL